MRQLVGGGLLLALAGHTAGCGDGTAGVDSSRRAIQLSRSELEQFCSEAAREYVSAWRDQAFVAQMCESELGASTDSCRASYEQRASIEEPQERTQCLSDLTGCNRTLGELSQCAGDWESVRKTNERNKNTDLPVLHPTSCLGWQKCAVGSKDPQVQLGMSLGIEQQNSCPTAGKVYRLGSPAPSIVNTGAPVLDGTNGILTSCSVRGQAPFTFSGVLYGLTSDADEIIVNFIDGHVGPELTTGTVSISVVTPIHGEASTTMWGDCSVSILDGQIQGGRLWAALSCPNLTVVPQGACSVASSSVILFEHCDGS